MRAGYARMTEKGRSPFFFVTLSSSSLAYAVSILPFGKMHDLQGGSSSSQILAALRFSGALFFRAVEWVLRVSAFAGYCPSPFLAFPLFKGEGGPLAVDEG